jgi:hypothetical protein
VSTKVVELAAGQWSAGVVQVEVTDTSPVMIANADPRRRELTVWSDSLLSVGVLWLVPNSGQRTGGIRLVPGAGYSFRHGAAVYGYVTGGAATANVVNESGEARVCD